MMIMIISDAWNAVYDHYHCLRMFSYSALLYSEDPHMKW